MNLLRPISALLTLPLFIRYIHAVPITVEPGTIADVQIDRLDTLNSSTHSLMPVPGSSSGVTTTNESAVLNPNIANSTGSFASDMGALSLKIVNKLGSNVTVYVTGLDSNGQLMLLDRSGSYYHPTASSSTPSPLGSNVALPAGAVNTTISLTLPGAISGGRIWVAEGGLQFFVIQTSSGPGLVQPSVVNPDDPNAVTNYAFAEFNWSPSEGLFTDISFADFVGLPLGISVLDSSGGTSTDLGLPADAAVVLCNELQAQARQDGRPWDQLCAYTNSGKLMRVLSPARYLEINGSAFDGYFSKYTSYCWHRYSLAPLTINTQSQAGDVNCTVNSNDTLICDGDNRGYAQPDATDIFGCHSGPFSSEPGDNDIHRAVQARLCAALNRATLYLPQGHVQPSGVLPMDYYSVHPANWYSAFVHRIEVDGLGYGFSEDDISPTTEDNVSGLIGSSDPMLLTVTVGGA